MLHRSPVKVFYNSKKEADVDNYHVLPEWAHKQTGQYNTFGGLRGDAKALFNKIQAGNCSAIKMFRCVETAGGRAVAQKCYQEVPIIVWCCGYETNTVPVTSTVSILDEHALRNNSNNDNSSTRALSPRPPTTPSPNSPTRRTTSPVTVGPPKPSCGGAKRIVNLQYDGAQVDVDCNACVLQR